jgi:hypothetical protein
MAIVGALLGSLGLATDATSYATSAAYTPTANALVLAFVYNDKATTPDRPTFSGNGLTWVDIDSSTLDSANDRRLTVFRAMGAAPSNGAGTADFGGVTQIGCCILVVEYTGVRTSGVDGADAVVQLVFNQALATTTLTVTLAAFENVLNGAAGAIGSTTNNVVTPGTDWTEAGDLGHASPPARSQSQWRADNDTSCDWTITSADCLGVALELREASVSPPGGAAGLRSIFSEQAGVIV